MELVDQPVWILIVEAIFLLFSTAIMWKIFTIINYLEEVHTTIKHNKELMHKVLEAAKDHNNYLNTGIERLSNEHLAHDSKLVASVAKFEENVNKSFDRNSDDLKAINTILYGHIKDETVDHTNILNEVKNLGRNK